MRKILLGLVAIPLIAIGSLTYATDNEFIVHDEEAGTITVYSQDKSYGITIQDKNLGATEIYTGVDNKNTYGYYFQWGNNYGNSGDSSTVSTLLSTDDLSNWANKGYSGNVTQFIKADNSYGDYRSGLTNYNETGAIQHSLWGGGNDNDDSDANIVKGYDTVNHVVTNPDNRQGPCPEGYHVPSAGEWQELMMLWCNANPDICSGSVITTQNGQDAWANYLNSDGIGTAFSNDLQLPLAGERRPYNALVFFQKTYAHYWSSSPRGDSDPEHAWYLYFGSRRVSPSGIYRRAYGQSIRCFKNSYVELPKTLNLFFMSDGEEVGTGEVTENMTGTVPEEAKNVTKTGYVLEYRYLSGADASTGFDFENTPISGAWADENNNVYFIAQWTGIKYEIKFDAGGGTGTMENQTFIYDVAQNLTANAFTKNGYTFSGWTDSEGNKYTDGQEVINLTTTGGEVITLTAEWTKNKTSGGSSGGGGSMKKDNCPNGDLSPSYYDGACEGANVSSGTDVKDLEGDTQDSSAEPQNDIAPLTGGDGEARGGYSQEFLNAYERAFKNGITTMNTIHKANMDGYIKRGHLAKMVVNYVTNVLGKEIPAIPSECQNWDDTYWPSAEIKDYATKSCALGLMGINMKNNEFLPNDYVPRSQFGAVLSRILRGDKYNLVHTQEKPRYTDHLNALKNEGIMTKIDNPKMQEKRGYVMIMLMRSVK